jgi:hypothetical protein
VAEAMHPIVVNLVGKKDAAGTEHAVNLRKHAVLQLARAKMMQDKNGDGRGEALRGEGELGGVSAKGAAGSPIVLRFQVPGGFGVVFERSNSRDGFAELWRGRAVAGANLEDMIAEGRAGQDPGKQLSLGEEAPERGGTQEVLKTVHGLRRGGTDSVAQKGGRGARKRYRAERRRLKMRSSGRRRSGCDQEEQTAYLLK